MTIKTASGTRIWIGPAIANTVDTEAEFEVLTFVEIGEVETLGEFGDEANIVNFSAIGDGRVRKLKGARDAGSLPLTVGRDPMDVGQAALVLAEKTKFEYAIKIEAADKPTPSHSNTIYYFRGLITSRRENYGENDNVVRKSFNIGINSEVLEILPTT